MKKRLNKYLSFQTFFFQFQHICFIFPLFTKSPIHDSIIHIGQFVILRQGIKYIAKYCTKCAIPFERKSIKLVDFGRARALRAPVFFNSLPSQTGRCAPLAAHRSFAASYSALKNIYNLSNLGRPRQGLFSFHWTTEAMRSPAPRPAPSGNILGSKVNTSATIRNNFFGFSFL